MKSERQKMAGYFLPKSLDIFKMRRSLILVFFALSISACGNVGTDEAGIYGNAEVQISNSSAVDFKMLSQNLLKDNCLRCHGNFQNEAKLRTYLVPGDPASSQIYDAVMSGRMPKNAPPLSKARIKILERYILTLKAEAEILQPSATPAPIDTEGVQPTYESLQKFLIKPSCLPCHSSGNEDGIREFESFDDVKKASEKMLSSMESGKMPKKTFSGPRPTPEMIATFRNWIAKNFPEH
jgi:hypothetical protein